jgi:hypothetical protein
MGAVGAGEKKRERVEGREAIAVADGGCDDDDGGVGDGDGDYDDDDDDDDEGSVRDNDARCDAPENKHAIKRHLQ